MSNQSFRMKKFKAILTAILLISAFTIITFLTAGCSKTSSQVKPGWEKQIMDMRVEKDKSFKESPSSPLAGLKRLTVLSGEKNFLVTEGTDIVISDRKTESAKLSLMGQDGVWTWEKLASDVVCKTRDKELQSGIALNGRVSFNVSRFLLIAYPSAKRLVLIVFDPERPQYKNFKQLSYFPPNAKYSVSATLEKLPKMTPLKMLTCRNLEKTFYRYAKIKFNLDGKPLELTAFKMSPDATSEHDILFIPFNDQTNGTSTYGTGRFLEIPEPEQTEFTLDFNICFNPLCSYSPAYNCPIPPSENFLDVSIPAGEKIYSLH